MNVELYTLTVLLFDSNANIKLLEFSRSEIILNEDARVVVKKYIVIYMM